MSYYLSFELFNEKAVLEQINIGFAHSGQIPIEFKTIYEVYEHVKTIYNIHKMDEVSTAIILKGTILEYNAFGAGYNRAKEKTAYTPLIYVRNTDNDM